MGTREQDRQPQLKQKATEHRPRQAQKDQLLSSLEARASLLDRLAMLAVTKEAGSNTAVETGWRQAQNTQRDSLRGARRSHRSTNSADLAIRRFDPNEFAVQVT